MGHLHARLKNYKLAVENIESAIKINAKSIEAYIQLALCYREMREYELERNLLMGLFDKFPKEGIFLMMLIECFIRLDEISKCEQFLATA
jgi:tetratricopeptide (TPR) repeat protein